MSFILDALRKSEQERQIAAGRGPGLLYPLIAEPPPKSRLVPLLLVAVLCFAGAAGAFWGLWPKPPALDAANAGKQEKSGLAASGPAVRAVPPVQPSATPVQPSATPVQPSATPVQPSATPVQPSATPVQPSATPVAAAAAREPSSKLANAPAKPAAVAEPKKRRAPGGEATPPAAPAVAAVAVPVEALIDEPKGLPAISITGYINDQDGSRLAIVNDKLLREGDEVSPGLRLEKIVDDAAIFSYKGKRFRR